MKVFDKKKYILKLINSNAYGVNIETIIDFLDYINKLKYEKIEIEQILKELIIDNKIIFNNNLYFKIR